MKLLTFADDTNLIGDGIKKYKNADLLLNVCKDIVLAVNKEKTNYTKIGRQSRHWC